MAETTTQRRWTVLSLLTWAAEYLAGRGFDESRLTADLLLAHVLGLRRMDLYLQYDRPLIEHELGSFKAAFKRRLQHEPLQYITGQTVFMGLVLEVTPAVLIPRPETEALVEVCCETLGQGAVAAPTVLDVGTGSGNVAIAIASRLPQAEVHACDVSGEALDLARRNVARHVPGRVTLEHGDLFGDLRAWRGFDLVVSNPPYVSQAEFSELQPEIRDFEPRHAVTDEDDGLRFLRRLCEVAPALLRPGGVLCVEIASDQGAQALEIAGQSGLVDAGVLPDLAHLPRILRARTSQEDRR